MKLDVNDFKIANSMKRLNKLYNQICFCIISILLVLSLFVSN